MAIGNHKVEIIVGVKDLASRSLGHISRSVTNMSKDFGRMGTMFGALNRNLDTTIGKMDRLANSMYKFNMYTSSIQRNLRNVGTVAALGAGTVGYQGLQNAVSFDYKTHTMQSRMETTGAVRKQLEDYILNELNLQVGFNPAQLADMGIVLGQAGISNAPDMKSLMKTTSYFSEAVDAVPEQAAEMIVAAAKGFNISMENSGQITDKLTVALNKSLLHVEEMPHAIGELAGRATMFGQSFDSSLVALMTMRDAGMSAAQGSQDFLHALRQASRIGNDDVMFARTSSYFESMGIGKGIFNQDTKKLKEYPELIADIEKAMINQGFSNNKYGVKDIGDFHKLVEKTGGIVPEDFWNSMKAMPLITKVFGAAGQAPILMGLQSKYEEVDKNTGEKTGQVYYGSEAIKRRYADVNQSAGAVDNTHKIIADSAQYQLEILGGAWQAAQIRFLDGILPVIKTGSEQLTNWLNPGGTKGPGNGHSGPGGPQSVDADYKSGIQKFEEAIQKAADNFRGEGHTGTADFIEGTGNAIVGGVKIGGTMPALFKQISEAFSDNFVNADWGSNIVEFPVQLVKNGINFINDLLKSNEEFQAAVEKLPKNLQDPAKLVETLTKGGMVLLVTGAVVKVVELGIRGVSTALKGAKLGTELAETIANALGKGGKGKDNPVSKLLGKTMNINANIVNVYGKAINGGGDLPDGPGTGTNSKGKGKSPATPKGKWNSVLGFAKNWGPAVVATDVVSGALGGPSVTKTIVQNSPLANKSEQKINEMHNALVVDKGQSIPKDTKLAEYNPGFLEKSTTALKEGSDKLYGAVDKLVTGIGSIINGEKNKNMPSATDNVQDMLKIGGMDTSIFGTEALKSMDTKTTNINNSIVSGFNSANERLQNVKVQNRVNVAMPAANITINGNVKEHISSVNVSPINRQYDDKPDYSGMSTNDRIMAKRLGWR